MTGPRVEGERVPDERLEEILSCDCLADCDMTGDEIMALAEETYAARALQRTDNSQVIAALTAEVERLRGIATDAVGWLDSRYHSGRVDAQARFRAALSLPTPAPEAQR